MRSTSTPRELYDEWLAAQIRTAVETGRAPVPRLMLIRSLHESTTLDLKQAKEVVDEYCARHDVPPTAVEPYRRVSPWIGVGILLVFGVLLASNYGLSVALPRTWRIGLVGVLLALGAVLAVFLFVGKRTGQDRDGDAGERPG